jgi:hypothetical protein
MLQTLPAAAGWDSLESAFSTSTGASGLMR